MFQRWSDLLFLHWRWDAEAIQRTLPPGLRVDTYEGEAYIGIVPFFMSGVRPRYCPQVPGLSSFLELNLRTYVVDKSGAPGVWFYSLDANQSIAVWIARRFFALNYVRAKMVATRCDDGWVTFDSKRRNAKRQRFKYRLCSETLPSECGTLAYFLAERYRLFSFRQAGNQLFAGRVHHSPYQLGEAEIERYDAELFAQNGFTSPERPPDHSMMAPGVDVDIFPMREL